MIKEEKNDAQSIDECIGKAIELCEDYSTPTLESNDIKEIWFTRQQILKLKKHVSRNQRTQVVNKDLYDEVLKVADKFEPATADTFSWEMAWLSEDKLRHIIGFCLIK